MDCLQLIVYCLQNLEQQKKGIFEIYLVDKRSDEQFILTALNFHNW